MIVNPKYYPLVNPSKNIRYVIVTGSRNSGKSYSLASIIAAKTHNEQRHTLYTRYTMTSAEKSIIPEFTEKMAMLGISKNYDQTKKSIEHKKTVNGNPVAKIDFKGIKASSGNQTANLKSLKDYSIWFLDEADELRDEEIFNRIDLSIRKTDRQNLIIISLNPCDVNHWIYQRFFQDSSVAEDFNGEKGNCLYIHTTYIDNFDNIEPEYKNLIKEIKCKYPERYQYDFLGKWRKAKDGVIYTNWKTGTFDHTLPFILSLDFGFGHKDAMVKVAINKKLRYIYIEQLIYESGLGTNQLVEKVKPIAQNRTVICDSAAARSIDDLKRNGVNAIPVKKGSVELEVKEIQGWTIIVCGESPFIIYELNNYCEKNGVIIKEFDDLMDAFRYGFKTLNDGMNSKVKPVKIMGIGGTRKH